MKLTPAMRIYDDIVADWFLSFTRWHQDTRIAIHCTNYKDIAYLKEIREQLWAVREGLAD